MLDVYLVVNIQGAGFYYSVNKNFIMPYKVALEGKLGIHDRWFPCPRRCGQMMHVAHAWPLP